MPSILHAQTFSDFELILVDNGSTDGSIEHVQQDFPGWVRVLRNVRNEGFSGGNNRESGRLPGNTSSS